LIKNSYKTACFATPHSQSETTPFSRRRLVNPAPFIFIFQGKRDPDTGHPITMPRQCLSGAPPKGKISSSYFMNMVTDIRGDHYIDPHMV